MDIDYEYEDDGETFACGIHVVGVDGCKDCGDCPHWCECEENGSC